MKLPLNQRGNPTRHYTVSPIHFFVLSVVLAVVVLQFSCSSGNDRIEFEHYFEAMDTSGNILPARCDSGCSYCELQRTSTRIIPWCAGGRDSNGVCIDPRYDTVTETTWEYVGRYGTNAYAICADSFLAPPPDPDPDEPVNQRDGVYTFSMAGSGDNRYGFDDCYDDASFNQPSYVSVRVDDRTSFRVSMASPEIYSKYIAVIHGDRNAVSFDVGGSIHVSAPFTSSHSLEIYAHLPTHEAKVSLFGVSQEPDTLPLIHDGTDIPEIGNDARSTSDQPLEVIVYEERVLSPSDLIVYGSPLFTKTPSQIVAGFNEILKQAVVRVGAPDLQPLSRSEWDLNDNGRMDRFLTDLVERPFEEDEFLAMIRSTGEDDGCLAEQNSAAYALDVPIYWNYMLVEEPVPDSDGTVRTLVVDPLFGGELGPAKIGPFWDTTGHRSILITAGHLTGTITVCLASDSTQGLPDVYSVEDTITVYTEFTGNEADHSCACVHHDASWGSFVHELLHGPFMGGLEHPRMTGNPEFQNDNIMYPFTPPDRVGVALRYRSIPVVPYGDLQSQWEEMHP